MKLDTAMTMLQLRICFVQVYTNLQQMYLMVPASISNYIHVHFSLLWFSNNREGSPGFHQFQGYFREEL